uniref:CSON006219 protein n=1 Tax=Culicoides sonorensis TaxID=179676 RepID=A0A336MT46_CULSO
MANRRSKNNTPEPATVGGKYNLRRTSVNFKEMLGVRQTPNSNVKNRVDVKKIGNSSKKIVKVKEKIVSPPKMTRAQLLAIEKIKKSQSVSDPAPAQLNKKESKGKLNALKAKMAKILPGKRSRKVEPKVEDDPLKEGINSPQVSPITVVQNPLGVPDDVQSNQPSKKQKLSKTGVKKIYTEIQGQEELKQKLPDPCTTYPDPCDKNSELDPKIPDLREKVSEPNQKMQDFGSNLPSASKNIANLINNKNLSPFTSPQSASTPIKPRDSFQNYFMEELASKNKQLSVSVRKPSVKKRVLQTPIKHSVELIPVAKFHQQNELTSLKSDSYPTSVTKTDSLQTISMSDLENLNQSTEFHGFTEEESARICDLAEKLEKETQSFQSAQHNHGTLMIFPLKPVETPSASYIHTHQHATTITQRQVNIPKNQINIQQQTVMKRLTVTSGQQQFISQFPVNQSMPVLKEISYNHQGHELSLPAVKAVSVADKNTQTESIVRDVDYTYLLKEEPPGTMLYRCTTKVNWDSLTSNFLYTIIGLSTEHWSKSQKHMANLQIRHQITSYQLFNSPKVGDQFPLYIIVNPEIVQKTSTTTSYVIPFSQY